jgi:hypothetical protein
MNYINSYAFLEDRDGIWREIIEKNMLKYLYSLFPEMHGPYF